MSILYLASYLTTNPLISQSRFIEPREFPEASSARTLGNSFKILAEVEFTGSAQGVIVSQGSRFGGYTLFVRNGKLIFIYNFLGIEEQRLVAEAPTIGKHSVGVQFVKKGLGPNHEAEGEMTLSIDNQSVATGAFKTQTEYKAKFDFSGGRVIKVTYKIVNDAHVNVERAMAAKMARD